MPFDPNKFAEELLKEAKVDESAKKALLSTFGDPNVAKRLAELNDGYMRQSDYSRKQAEAQEALKKAEDWYQNLTVWYQTKQAELQNPKAGGTGNPQDDLDTASTPNPGYLAKSEVEQLLAVKMAERDRDSLAVLSTVNNLGFDYYKQFGEPLDTAALIKKAQDDRTSLAIAYERMIQPKIAERSTKELEERIKRERAEAAQEALANANIPSMGTLNALSGDFVHPLDGLKPTDGGVPKFGWKAAAKAHTDAVLSGKRITSDEGF